MKQLLELAATFATRGIAAVGGVLLSIAVSRIAGAGGLGQFTLFISVLGAFSIFSRRGLGLILTRTTAQILHSGQAVLITQLLRHGIKLALITALILAIPGSILLGRGVFGPVVKGGGWAFLVSLPLLTLLAVVAGYMKGLGKAWLGALFEIGGISFGAALLLLAYFMLGLAVNLTTVMVLFMAALGIFCFAGLYWVSRNVAPYASRQHEPLSAMQIKTLFRGQFPFTVIALAGFLVQAGSFAIVAPFLSDSALGLARSAERLALLVSFPVLAINPYIAAPIARFAHSNDMTALWQMIRKAVVLGAAVALPPLVVLLFFPSFMLSVFGRGFSDAAPFLRLLAVTQFVAVLLGPFTMVLAMSGAERPLMWLSGTALCVAVILYPLLAVRFGVWGFLVGYSIVSVGRLLAAGLLTRWWLVNLHKFGYSQ